MVPEEPDLFDLIALDSGMQIDSLELAKSITEAFPDPFVVLGAAAANVGDVKIIGASNSALSLFGTNYRGDLVDKHVKDFLDDTVSIDAATSAYFDTNPTKVHHLTLKIKRDSGEIRTVEASASPIQREGTTIANLVSLRDVTEQKKLQKELEDALSLYALHMENNPASLWTVDRELRFNYVSPAVHSLFGYTPEELLGVRVLDILDRESREKAKKQIVEQISSRNFHPIKDTYRLKTRSGAIVWADIHSQVLLREGEILGIVGVSSDATERIMLHEELVRAEKQALVAAIAGQMADKMNNALTGPMSAAAMLIENCGEDSLDFKNLQIIQAGLERTQRMNRKLLYLTGMKGREYPGSINDDWSMAADVLRDTKARERGIQIFGNYDTSIPQINVSHDDLREAFCALLENSVLASQRGRGVAIRTYRIDNTLVSEVVDAGCGIKKEDFSHIFNPFFTRNQIGDGLGLAVTKAIIENNGGAVFCSSKYGVGTTMTVKFPIK